METKRQALIIFDRTIITLDVPITEKLFSSSRKSIVNVLTFQMFLHTNARLVGPIHLPLHRFPGNPDILRASFLGRYHCLRSGNVQIQKRQRNLQQQEHYQRLGSLDTFC